MTIFRCPACRRNLTLARIDDGLACAECGWLATGPDGILNFVMDPALRAESEHFDDEYREQVIHEPRDPKALGQLWTDYPNAPFNKSILQRILLRASK